MIFVDADFFIGIVSHVDAHHVRAVEILERVRSRGESLITSWDVIDEVSTKLSYYISKELAKDFLGFMASSDIQVEYADKVVSEAAKKIFLSFKSKKISMTDCVNMALANKHKIKRFLSFDKHYLKGGFELVA
jgi:predicted nucleic acid-binding protein